MLWFILAIVFGVVFYKLWKIKNYWEDREVPYVKSALLFGNSLETILRKRSFIEVAHDIYCSHPNARYVGFMQTTIPILMIRDLDLIKQICIKDFDSFPEHQALTTEEDLDPLWFNNLFATKAKKWRDLRPMLSPAFTSSKMKLMFQLMESAARQFTCYFLKAQQKASEVELKDVFTRFTNDVIATSAFGIQCDSLENKDNEFYLMGRNITNFTGIRSMKFFFFSLAPKVAKVLGIKVFPPKPASYFVNVIETTMKEREQKNIVRPDLINLLLEARRDNGPKHEEQSGITDTGFAAVEESTLGKYTKTQKRELTDYDVYAQCLIFFFAGFDTVSTALSLTVYELALNPDIQDKLRKEIDNVWQECDGKLSYDALSKMKYMDMVVSEGLRKWAPAAFSDRRCVKPYTIPPTTPEEKPIQLKPGDIVSIPIYSIHKDPRYFPEPEKFDPERFSEERKHTIPQGSYMPFGTGPRNCIGSRFALLEMKTLLFHLLQSFEVLPNKKTQVPLVFSKTSFNLTGEKGIWLEFTKRQG